MTYQTMRDIYQALKRLTQASHAAKYMGLSPAGLAFKCIRTQYLTVKERDKLLRYLGEVQAELSEMAEAIEKLPTRK